MLPTGVPETGVPRSAAAADLAAGHAGMTARSPGTQRSGDQPGGVSGGSSCAGSRRAAGLCRLRRLQPLPRRRLLRPSVLPGLRGLGRKPTPPGTWQCSVIP